MTSLGTGMTVFCDIHKESSLLSRKGGSCDGEQVPKDAAVLLEKLVAIFPKGWARACSGEQGKDAAATPDRYDWITASEMPEPYFSLLAHEEHLTKILEDRHGKIGVQVAEVVHDAGGVEGLYSRRIFLEEEGATMVARAVLQADLKRLPDVVRIGVVEQGIPFGKLLMDHVKERCVCLKALWKVSLGHQGFGGDGRDAGQITYGRTVIIECDGAPAAEVLEVLPCMPPVCGEEVISTPPPT